MHDNDDEKIFIKKLPKGNLELKLNKKYEDFFPPE